MVPNSGYVEGRCRAEAESEPSNDLLKLRRVDIWLLMFSHTAATGRNPIPTVCNILSWVACMLCLLGACAGMKV